MSIEQSLERIAAALEKLSAPMIRLGVDPVVPATIQAAQQEPAKDPIPEAPTLANDRDAIKKQLDAAGIKYNPKLSTKSLAALLKSPELTAITEEGPAATSFIEPEPPKVYTAEDAKEILKRFAAKFGSDKAVKILADFKCANITAVAAANKLPEFIAEVLKQEADHGRK